MPRQYPPYPQKRKHPKGFGSLCPSDMAAHVPQALLDKAIAVDGVGVHKLWVASGDWCFCAHPSTHAGPDAWHGFPVIGGEVDERVLGTKPPPPPAAPSGDDAGTPNGQLLHGLMSSPMERLDDVFGSSWSLGGSSRVVKHGDAQPLALTSLTSSYVIDDQLSVMALSGDGALVAVGSKDLRVWRVGESEPFATWNSEQGGARTLAFTGQELWVGGADGSVVVLNMEAL